MGVVCEKQGQRMPQNSDTDPHLLLCVVPPSGKRDLGRVCPRLVAPDLRVPESLHPHGAAICRGVGLPAVLRHGWVTAGLVKAGQCVPRDAGPSAGSALPRAHACLSISVLGCGRGSPLCGAETADGAELGQPSAASGSSPEVHVIYSPDLCFLFHHPGRDASLLFSEQQLRPKNGGSGLSSPELSHKKE